MLRAGIFLQELSVMSYKVTLENFEGPFDLLVYLVESAEMSIYDIKIAEITDRYLEYLRAFESEPDGGEISAEFLVLAATLIEIKSRMLLPVQPSSGDEPELEDPRKDLVEKLLEYKKFKEASFFLEKREEDFIRRMYKPMEDLSDYDNNGAFDVLKLDPDKFIEVFKDFLERRKKLEEIQSKYGGRAARDRRVTVRQRMRRIRHLLASGETVAFRDVVDDCNDNYEVASTFVALLELMRNGSVTVKQKKNFGEIYINGRKADGKREN